MNGRSKKATLGFSSTAVVLVLAGVAWACTAVPSCSASPDSGAMGTRVSINCIGFQRQAPVEIRWDSADGPVIGSAVTSDRDGSFSVAVNPPENATADVHYLLAVHRAADGSVSEKASDTFELTTSGGSRTAARSALDDNWSGFSAAKGADEALTSSPAQQPGTSGFALGVALLAAGMVSIAGLAVVAGTNKRRTRA